MTATPTCLFPFGQRGFGALSVSSIIEPRELEDPEDLMKTRFRWQSVVLLSLLFSLLVVFTSTANQAANYDFNRNDRIEDSEFFAALDDWLAGTLDNSSFYLIIDLWTSAGLITNSSPAQIGQCPALTNLMALKNGIPIQIRNQVSSAALSNTPIDIAFREDFYLPQGTIITFDIKGTTEGAEPRNVKFKSPMPNVTFTDLGSQRLFGNATLQTEINLPAQYEWAQFTPYWSNSTNSGSFFIEVDVQAPGCNQLKMRLTLNLNKSTSSNPAPVPGCPVPTRVIAMRNGIPFGTSSSGMPPSTVLAQDLTAPLEIAFENRMTLPQGANLNLEISSDQIGLEPRNPAFLSPLSSGTFTTLNAQLVRGSAVAQNEVTLQSQYEWARFTPYWDSGTSSGRFTIKVTITSPNCATVEMTRSYSMSKTTGGYTPPSSNPNCPGPTSLVAMRNGLPIGGNSQQVVAAGLTRPMEIAFTKPTYLPPGTSLTLNISSDTAGLEPHNGEFLSSLSGSNFVNLGALAIEGTATTQNGVNFQPQFEWAKFTPMWATNTTSGYFALRATINAPNCSQIIATRNYAMRKLSAASFSSELDVRQTPFSTVLSAINGIELEVEVFSLAGSSLYLSHKARKVVLSASSLKQVTANGVLLYVVRFYSSDGLLQTSEVKKLVLMK